jgi:hypothetical protein
MTLLDEGEHRGRNQGQRGMTDSTDMEIQDKDTALEKWVSRNARCLEVEPGCIQRQLGCQKRLENWDDWKDTAHTVSGAQLYEI